MDELAVRSLDRWLIEQLPLISPRKAAYDHIDYIFDRTIPPADTLAFALQAFNTLIEILEGQETPVKPGLMIPLFIQQANGDEAEGFVRAIPRDRRELEARWRREEPPSLYLLDWDTDKYFRPRERYHCPLPFDLFTPMLPGVWAFYSASRDQETLAHNWPYCYVCARRILSLTLSLTLTIGPTTDLLLGEQSNHFPFSLAEERDSA